jgi:lipoate-protein ligase A
MDFLDCTLESVADNLALDEALLLSAEAGHGPEVLRVWEWPAPAVVLGAGCVLADDVDEAACARDGVPILRRSSGGGTVLLGSGCLLYSLVLALDQSPELAQIGPSYRFLLGRVVRALGLADLRTAGISDLALGRRKVSGNAQQRKRTHLLHHGTLLYAYDVTRVGRYLRLPSRRPEYRQDRAHEDFLSNLPLPRHVLVQGLRDEFTACAEGVACLADAVRQLVAAKYGRPEWTARR